MVTHLQNFTEIQKNLVSEVVTLVKLILVLPAANATSDSFSLLSLIKSYLRSTTGQSHLNHLILVDIYKRFAILICKKSRNILSTKVRII